jgi:hypothetical protein
MRERDGETLVKQLGAASGRSGHDLRDVHPVEAAVDSGCSMHPLSHAAGEARPRCAGEGVLLSSRWTIVLVTAVRL